MLRPGKRWYLPAALALAAFFGGPLLVQARVLAPLQGFMLFAVSGLFGAVCLVWGLRLAGLKDLKKTSVMLVCGLVPLVTLLAGLAAGRKVPRINDVATDLDNPPHLAAARDAPYPPEFKGLVQAGYPDLLSRTVDMAPAQAFAKVKDAAKAMPGWEITRADDQSLTLEGTQTSAVFRFVDDFVVRVEPLDTRAVIAMRSKSRDGKGDFGVNAARIRAFYAALAP